MILKNRLIGKIIVLREQLRSTPKLCQYLESFESKNDKDANRSEEEYSIYQNSQK